MGMGEDYDMDYEPDYYEEGKQDDIWEISTALDEKDDDELLETAINMGESLDNQFEHFPAYSIAKKIKDNNWKLSKKQREAIINVTARYIYENDLADDILGG